MVPARLAAGLDGRQGARHRHRTVQPRRPGNPERDRAPGLRCAHAPPGNLEATQALACGTCGANETGGWERRIHHGSTEGTEMNFYFALSFPCTPCLRGEKRPTNHGKLLSCGAR